MAFDGLFTRAITHEIANSLYTGRISKYINLQNTRFYYIFEQTEKSKTHSFRSSDICTFTLNKSKLRFTCTSTNVLYASS